MLEVAPKVLECVAHVSFFNHQMAFLCMVRCEFGTFGVNSLHSQAPFIV